MWVSDALMSLLGYSKPAVVQYVISIAKKASSPSKLVSTLVDLGLSSSGETEAFAQKIFSRVEHKTPGPNLYRQRKREAALLVKKQKTYTILEGDDDDDDDSGGAVARGSASAADQSRKEDDRGMKFRKRTRPQEDASRKEDNRGKKFRKRTKPQEDEEDEKVRTGEEEKSVRRRASKDESDGSESEKERLLDQREREELERHIRERDAAGTRKLNEQRLTKKEEEETIRRTKALENDETETLRKVSRQEYLKKREQKKLDELRDEIEDELYLFDGVKLTESELRELRYKKEIYELVKKRTQENDGINEYRMPEAYDQEGSVNQDKRFAVALKRYRDAGASEKMNPFAEQEAWEEHQIGNY